MRPTHVHTQHTTHNTQPHSTHNHRNGSNCGNEEAKLTSKNKCGSSGIAEKVAPDFLAVLERGGTGGKDADAVRHQPSQLFVFNKEAKSSAK